MTGLKSERERRTTHLPLEGSAGGGMAPALFPTLAGVLGSVTIAGEPGELECSSPLDDAFQTKQTGMERVSVCPGATKMEPEETDISVLG